ncbi:hypothetical protein FJV41_48205 [Myxococcus llanfairpwllgwyngyllgogerychwyrndrobwllllantysiliogogogochensis]|uniref:Uncharacterized protein n=1 Tax=Myxococcus llanfairpwllgwyngyllgogerychwyrndrobwllllantysiliogogogochensis TaxID=2590453 RepID=A0A540WIB9_9BACT|nr:MULTISPECIES: hypothetical protein [Myxococcus]TQF08756.1 hypothetical protein FJV41_48205 [Myxococcus llanfairpwllgwyngyllgogerychwyrndrobwllllantysiliogogogochensis]
MLCFRVLRNGRHITTAGVPDFGVLSTILTWVRRPHDESNANPELTLHVGGSVGREHREHLKWCYANNIRAGDVLTVEVRDDVESDPPRERYLDEEAGLDDVARLQLRKKSLEAQLSDVNEALRERGAA